VVPGIIAFNLFSGDMQNQAVTDNAVVIARYLKANPDTKLVEVVESPSPEAIAAWPSGRFMLAVYPEGQSMRAALAANPFVLPLSQTAYATVAAPLYPVFESDDKAWTGVFPQLAAELEVYNQRTIEAARAANASVRTEKFIAYKYDTALGQLLSGALPQGVGLVGFVLAALLGAVVSSLAAMLNAASTIFTMDVYKKYISPNAAQGTIVFLGRVCVVVFAAIAVFLAPQLGNPKVGPGIFTIIQASQGFLSPGILAVFAFGLLVRKAPPLAGVVGLLLNVVAYGFLWYLSTVPGLMANDTMAVLIGSFLNRMAICFALCLAVMALITYLRPLPQPIVFKLQTNLDLTSSRGALAAGIVIVIITLAFYVIFSPLGVAR
jgi:solute:Na+ symporter, SSS family